jgi:hypothetical protein
MVTEIGLLNGTRDNPCLDWMCQWQTMQMGKTTIIVTQWELKLDDHRNWRFMGKGVGTDKE